MIHNTFCLLLLLFLAGTQVQSQPVSLLSNANSVVNSYDVTYRVSGDASATVAYKKVVTLLNDKHQGKNFLREWYDSDTKLSTFKATVTDVLGKEIWASKKSDWKDERYTSEGTFYEDSWYRTVEAPCHGYPCTLVFEVEQKLSGFGMMAFPHWQPQERDQAVVAATFTAYLPSDNELLYDSRQTGDPFVTTAGKETVYSWRVDSLFAQQMEPLAPPATETLPYLRVGLAKFRIDDYQGSFTDWNSFGNFMATIMAGRDQLPDQLERQVNSIILGAESELERIDLLYQFMQQRMRYVGIQLGIGGWQPYSADYVETNRYGDCKALSNYMGALLKHVGIESYPVLIHRSDRSHYPVSENFATSAFNHMVLYVPTQTMYLECTANDYPTGYFGEDKQDRNALWITPAGGKLVRTPSLKPADNGYVRKTSLTLGEERQVSYSVSAEYFGAAQEIHRAILSYSADRKDQIKALNNLHYLPDVTGEKFAYEVDPASPRARLSYSTLLQNHTRNLGSRIFMPINPHPYDMVPAAVPARQLPVETTEARFFVDTVNLRIPAGLEIESGAFTEPISYAFAENEYHAELQPLPEGVQWIRSLKLVPVSLPAEQYADYREFMIAVSKAERFQLVLKERRTK